MAIATANSAKKWKGVIQKQMGVTGFVQLKHETGATVDPNTGQYLPGKTVLTDIVAVVVEYGEEMQSNSNIQLGDKKIIASYDCGYLLGDYILIGGVQYSIIDPNPINPNGYLQVYEFHVRKS